jgi:hypothetical protein
MAKTGRVEYLIDRINSGDITEDEWSEVEEIITMGRPMDYTPIIPGTDHEPIPDVGGPSFREVPEPRYSTTPKDASPLSPAPVEEGSRLDGIAAIDHRLRTMEAAMTDIVRRMKALEDRIIGEKQ